MPRDRRDSSGFTLVEVMIVLAILGLVATLALPLLARRTPTASLASAAEEVRAALAAARSAAIAEDREVSFSAATDGYRVDGEPHRFPPGADLSLQVRGGARIAFFPSGGSSGGRVILHSASARREIEIEAITGRAALVP